MLMEAKFKSQGKFDIKIGTYNNRIESPEINTPIDV